MASDRGASVAAVPPARHEASTVAAGNPPAARAGGHMISARVAAALARLGARLPASIDRGWPGLRQLKLLTLRRLAPGIVERDGLVVELDPTDSLRLAMGDDHEPSLVQLLPRLLREGDCAVDGGAHVGYLTLHMARCVGPSGRVVAFEPDPDSFGLLEGNLRRNRCRNVTAVRKALWDSAGAGRLFRYDHHHADHRVWDPGGRRASVEIQLTTLDGELAAEARRLRLVKLDLQGAELHALRGMAALLRERRGIVLVVELWPEGLRGCGDSARELVRFLADMDYLLAVLPERPAPPTPVETHELLRWLEPDGATGRLRRACRRSHEVDLLCLPEGVTV